MGEANRVLSDFLSRFNARFGVPAAQMGSAYRLFPQGLEREGVLCFKYQRTVAGDNTVRFAGHTLQILPGPDRPSYAHARVEVQERPDGSLMVAYQGRVLATRMAPAHPLVLRARKGARGDSPATDLLVGVIPDGIRDQKKSKVGLGPDHEHAPHQAGNNGNGHKPSPTHPWRHRPPVTKSLNH